VSREEDEADPGRKMNVKVIVGVTSLFVFISLARLYIHGFL
jgi:hypothetical protein